MLIFTASGLQIPMNGTSRSNVKNVFIIILLFFGFIYREVSSIVIVN